MQRLGFGPVSSWAEWGILMGKILGPGVFIAALLLGAVAQATPPAPRVQVTDNAVVRVQAVNPELQIQQLEETVRDLNGRMEELNFQMLQMQEQMRKMQEDNEFRFQELEKGNQKSGALEKPVGGDSPADTGTAEAVASAGSDNQPNEDTAIENQTSDAGQEGSVQPGTLGSLIFNRDGQMITPDQPDNQDGGSSTGTDTSETASEGQADIRASEEDAYQTAYSLILSGDYKEAERSFKGYLDAYPEGTRAADAAFWLGEAQYSQGKYKDAAETFFNTYKAYGTSEKAPEVLLKLGMSLAALDNRDTACATLKEIPKRFPKASKIVITKVANEQARLGC